jgi:hypothetical protein
MLIQSIQNKTIIIAHQEVHLIFYFTKSMRGLFKMLQFKSHVWKPKQGKHGRATESFSLTIYLSKIQPMLFFVLFSLFCFLQGIMCRKKPMNETTTDSSIQFYQLFLYFLEFEFFYFFLFYVLSLYLFLSLQQVYYMFWTVVKEYEITTKFYFVPV